jgi:hypothetical protein
MIQVGDVVEYLGNHTGDGWVKGKFYTVAKKLLSTTGDFIEPLEVVDGNDHESTFRVVGKNTTLQQLQAGNGSYTLPSGGAYNHSIAGYTPMPKEYLAKAEPEPIKAKLCECGSDSVKSSIHSDYCPKYER